MLGIPGRSENPPTLDRNSLEDDDEGIPICPRCRGCTNVGTADEKFTELVCDSCGYNFLLAKKVLL